MSIRNWSISILIVMAILRDLPAYYLRGGLMFISFFFPVLLVLAHAKSIDTDSIYILAAIYCLGCVILTIFITRKLLIFSQSLKKKDHEKINIDLAVFRFIFSVMLYGGVHFTVYYTLVQLFT